MGGIVGYIGRRDAIPVLLEGLRSLEYRGYDSAGLAVIHRNKLQITKTAGRVQDLRDRVNDRAKATIGIGHTRWATHGEPTDLNAHPHTDSTGHIAVVHNGIIENAEQLIQALTQRGVELVSDTDTEALAHMIAVEATGEVSLEDAVRRVLAWMGGNEGNQYVGRRGGAIPAVRPAQKVYFDYWAAKNVDVKPFFAVLNGPRIDAPGGAGFAAGNQVLKPYFDEMFLGRGDVSTTLHRAQEAANAATRR